jgi:carbon storage regulator CsrA
MDGPIAVGARAFATLTAGAVGKNLRQRKGTRMLALSRGEGQSIIIDGRIEVKIVKWSRSSVRLAIQAPREVKVDRDEIWREAHPNEATPLEQAESERQQRMASGEMPAKPLADQPKRTSGEQSGSQGGSQPSGGEPPKA